MPVLLCCHKDCPVKANVEVPIDHLTYPLVWYCQKHRDITMFQPKTLREGAGVSIEIKPDMKEALIQKQAEALDCATYALEFIMVKGCDCPDDNHKGTCHVLAALNGLDSIKVKMGL